MKQFWIVAFALAAGAPAPSQGEKKGDERFERLKKLVGEWAGEDGKVSIKYALTAGGSALIETIGPGTKFEMVTVYTMDGKDLVLTHYCMLGNQPRMKAAEKFDGKTLAFTCTGVGNAATHDDMHMHSVTFEFTDDDHLSATWGSFAKGKDGDVQTFKKTRKK